MPQQPNPYAQPPAGNAYGQPSSTPGAPYSQPPAQKGSNGLAVAALILGILPTGLIGLIVGILAIVKAAKTGAGKAMAWIGTILSILWIAGLTLILVAVMSSDTVQTAVKRMDPGCVSFESQSALANRMQNETDPAAMKKDIQQVLTELKADQAKTKSADVRSAMAALQKDFEDLQTAMETGNVPSDLIDRLGTDGTAVDTACGQ